MGLPKTKRPVGRPMLSRVKYGYEADLAHLSRLRSACLADPRLGTARYGKIVEAIRIVETILRKLPR